MQTYLQTINFYQLSSWSSYALLGKNLIYTQKFPFVRIGNFLRRNKTQVAIEEDVIYKRATIRINGNGISLRDEVLGKEIGTKNQFVINEGQFLLSKIDARNGAFGVVPKELDNGIITGNFWTFDVDYTQINPHYLTLLTGTKKFQSLSQTASVGTTNRNYLQEDLFLNFEIPLPTIAEQKRIVKSYQDKIDEAERLEKEAKGLDGEIERYLFEKLGVNAKSNAVNSKSSSLSFIKYKEIERWSLSFINKNKKFSFADVKFEILPIKYLLSSFDGGKTPSTYDKSFWGGDINWFSAKDMKALVLSESEDKITNNAIENAGMKLHPKGSILGVFRSGILRHSFPVALLEKPSAINQDLKAMNFDSSLIYNVYALYYLHLFQKFILEQSQKTGVTVESINTEEFLEIPVVLPPLEKQKEIADVIKKMKYNIYSLKQQAIVNKQSALVEFEQEIFNN